MCDKEAYVAQWMARHYPGVPVKNFIQEKIVTNTEGHFASSDDTVVLSSKSSISSTKSVSKERNNFKYLRL